MLHHFALARRQLREAFGVVAQIVGLRDAALLQRERCIDRSAQLRVVERFFQGGLTISDGSDELSPWRRNPWLTVDEAKMLQKLRNTYCRSIGVEYMHINERPIRKWMQERMEGCENHLNLSRKEQLRILTRLTDAVVFEEFIRKKFIGAKSFSLEGSESLIPLLDLAIEKAGDQGVLEVVIGMAHRGRLNVLCNIMGKSPGEIFREFADTKPAEDGTGGDVKYHKGYSNDWKTSSKKTVHTPTAKPTT